MLLALALAPPIVASAGEQYILMPKVDGVVAPSSTPATPAAFPGEPPAQMVANPASQGPQALAVVPDPSVATEPPQGSSSEQSTLVPPAAPAYLPPPAAAVAPPAVAPAPSFAPGSPGSLFGPSIASQGQGTSSPTLLGVVNQVLEWTGPGCCPTPSFGNHTMAGGRCLCDAQDLNAPPIEYAPNFMGDLLGSGGYVLYSANPRFAKYVPLPIAGGDGGFKISDNNNPLPTSRLFFDYDHATNALQDTTPEGKINFDRFSLGIEQVLFWDSASIELRLPIAQGLNSDLSSTEASGTAFGNIPVVYKQMFWSSQDTFLSGGLAVVAPTAPEAVIHTPNALTYVVRNESVHLDPFLGAVFKPDPRAFVEGFLSVDFVTNGDAVFQNVGGTLNKLGVYQAQTLICVDLKAGYWLYRGPETNFLVGIAPSVEFHYSTTLQIADTAGPVTNPFNLLDVCDLTAGLHVQMERGLDLNVGISVPLKPAGSDRPYDNACIVQVNQRY
jgi:hypothetical protein